MFCYASLPCSLELEMISIQTNLITTEMIQESVLRGYILSICSLNCFHFGDHVNGHGDGVNVVYQ